MKKKTILAALAAAVVCAISVTGTLAYLTAQSNGGSGVVNTFVGATELIDQSEDPKPPVPPKPDPDNPDPDPEPIEDINDYSFIVAEHLAGWVKNETTNVETLEFVTENGDKAATATDAAIVLWNNYKLLPGVDAPKDPFVHIDAEKKTDIGAYLFIKVEGLSETGNVSAAIDSANWTEVNGVDGLYVYQGNSTATPNVITKTSMDGQDLNINVLDQKTAASGKAVTVKNLTSQQLADDPNALDHEITVKAYMVQAVELTDSFTLANLYETAFGSGNSTNPAPDPEEP